MKLSYFKFVHITEDKQVPTAYLIPQDNWICGFRFHTEIRILL